MDEDVLHALRTALVPVGLGVVLLLFGVRGCGHRATPPAQDGAGPESAPGISETVNPVAAPGFGAAPPPVANKFPEGLTPEYAKSLIESESHFREPASQVVPKILTGTSARGFATLRSLGYFEVKTEGNQMHAVITDAGRRDIDHLVENETSYTFPLAAREVVQVSQITPRSGGTPDEYLVSFRWRYQPNAIGVKLGMNDRPQQGSAIFVRNQGSWYVTELIEPRL